MKNISITLNSGQEIVAQLIKTEHGNITIGKPRTVVPTEKGIGLSLQVSMTSDPKGVEELHIGKNGYAYYLPISPEFEKVYLETTSVIKLIQ